MSIYATYWKGGFFQRRLRVNTVRIEKYTIKTRKVRISAEVDIQQNFSLVHDKLDVHSDQTKKEISNLV